MADPSLHQVDPDLKSSRRLAPLGVGPAEPRPRPWLAVGLLGWHRWERDTLGLHVEAGQVRRPEAPDSDAPKDLGHEVMPDLRRDRSTENVREPLHVVHGDLPLWVAHPHARS